MTSPPRPRSSLVWQEDFPAEAERAAAYGRFLTEVFDMPAPARRLPPAWHAFGLFEADGRCVAAAEMADLTVAAEGRRHDAAGLRLVGVVADWRGRGLFRALMEHALARGADRAFLLLYAAEPDLYRRFGFAAVPQHAFAGPPPAPVAAPAARPLPDPAAEARLIERLLATRAPLSESVALVDAPALFLGRLGGQGGGDLRLAHLPGPDAASDALLAFEEDGDTLVIADVAAAAMPGLPAILGALPRRYAAVRTLFPPDRLGWRGSPVPEDTGLMARGPLPPAMCRPFMLPPTTEF